MCFVICAPSPLLWTCRLPSSPTLSNQCKTRPFPSLRPDCTASPLVRVGRSLPSSSARSLFPLHSSADSMPGYRLALPTRLALLRLATALITAALPFVSALATPPLDARAAFLRATTLGDARGRLHGSVAGLAAQEALWRRQADGAVEAAAGGASGMERQGEPHLRRFPVLRLAFPAWTAWEEVKEQRARRGGAGVRGGRPRQSRLAPPVAQPFAGTRSR